MPEGEAAAGAALHGAAAGAVKAGMELLDVVFKWIVPLIALVVGFLLGAGIGLSGVIADLLDGVLPAQVPGQAIGVIGCLVAIAIWGGVGASLWGLAQKYDGKWAHYILRPIATLFIGFALSEIPPVFKGGVNKGSLGTLTAGAATAAGAH